MHDEQVVPAATAALRAQSKPAPSLSAGAAAALALGATLTTSDAHANGITPAAAARFLTQAAMGSSRADIQRVCDLGYDGWIAEQQRMPRTDTHWNWLVARGYTAATQNFNTSGFDHSMWRQLVSAPDQLRQRVAMALLDFLVISVADMRVAWPNFAAAAYVDMLLDNAFGNYRTLLDKVCTSVAMGQYLTFTGNRKANPATGTVPDENMARELLQLFTIGLTRLNSDGSPQILFGRALDSYTQADVAGLARVFTGFVINGSDTTTPDRLRLPLTQNASRHELGTKTFLGYTIPAGIDGFNSLRMALDVIFAHPNVPPFVCKQLIKRLVTSNPAPAYVRRVAAVFRNNGSGVRGDLAAVVRAILLDPEARFDSQAAGPYFGKLRAPVNRFTAWARAFGANSPTDIWNIGDTSTPGTRLAQSTGRSPSVFNFFRPGYTPPNTEISARGMVGPEFQITNETSTTGYVNYMLNAIRGSGTGEVRADYTALLALAPTPQALVDEVSLVLGARLSPGTIATIVGAVGSISTSASGLTNRVYTAILLTMASPEFIAQK